MTDEKDDTALGLLGLLLLAATIWLEPHVMRLIWQWYFVPAGLPPVTWSQAFALNLIVAILVYRWSGERDTDENVKAQIGALVTAGFALALAWIFK